MGVANQATIGNGKVSRYQVIMAVSDAMGAFEERLIEAGEEKTAEERVEHCVCYFVTVYVYIYIGSCYQFGLRTGFPQSQWSKWARRDFSNTAPYWGRE